MGIILEPIFDRLPRTSRSEAGRPVGECQIVIFPGVRIERSESPPSDLLPPRKASGPRRRKRSRKTA